MHSCSDFSARHAFIADRMLGRLAKMLRLLGYDTLYSSQMTPTELSALARRQNRVLLTRGNIARRFPELQNVFSVRSDSPPEQLREVVAKFRLDTHSGLWSRCTLCNGEIESAAKTAVKALVPPKVFQLYHEFFRCAGCGHIYWRGSHVDRVARNLEHILSGDSAAEPSS